MDNILITYFILYRCKMILLRYYLRAKDNQISSLTNDSFKYFQICDKILISLTPHPDITKILQPFPSPPRQTLLNIQRELYRNNMQKFIKLAYSKTKVSPELYFLKTFSALILVGSLIIVLIDSKIWRFTVFSNMWHDQNCLDIFSFDWITIKWPWF